MRLTRPRKCAEVKCNNSEAGRLNDGRRQRRGNDHDGRSIGSRGAPAHRRANCARRVEVACFDHVFPATGEVQGPVPLAGPSDIDDAVRARHTRRSRRGGRGHRGSARDALVRLGDLLERRPRRTGPPVGPRQRHDATGSPSSPPPRCATTPATTPDGPTRSKARVTSSPAHGRELAYTIPEPYGVIGIIITWNGPLVSIGMKVIPALAAGNTVVIKPSELTPYATEHFMDLVKQAGIPAGVVNMVPGTAEAGEALVRHPLVQKISFTGGPTAARADPRRLRRGPEAGGARAGRQVGQLGVSRRRPRRGGVHRHGVGPPDPRRAGVCAGHPPPRPRQRV